MLRKVCCLQGMSCLTGTIWEKQFLPILCKCEVRCLFFCGLCIGSSLLPRSLFKLERNCKFPRLPSLQPFLFGCHFHFSFSWSFHLSFLYLIHTPLYTTMMLLASPPLFFPLAHQILFIFGAAWVSSCFFFFLGLHNISFWSLCSSISVIHQIHGTHFRASWNKKHTLASA